MKLDISAISLVDIWTRTIIRIAKRKFCIHWHECIDQYERTNHSNVVILHDIMLQWWSPHTLWFIGKKHMCMGKFRLLIKRDYMCLGSALREGRQREVRERGRRVGGYREVRRRRVLCE